MLKYSFKFYYEDGSSKIAGGKSSKPEYLKYDFDGLISWEEYDKIADDKSVTAQDIVNMAKQFFNKFENERIVKVEIINIETNEVVVSSNQGK